jgi:voltage-gated potassium channel
MKPPRENRRGENVAKKKLTYEQRMAPLSKAIDSANYFLMVLGFGYLGIYSVEVLVEPPSDIGEALDIAGWVIYVIFIIDLLARTIVWLPRFKTLGGWGLFAKENWLSILAAFAPAFRSFRVLRVLLVLRGIAPFIKSRLSQLAFYAGVALPLIIYTASLSILEAERDAVGANITTFGDALWWSVVTVTTVGYGDSFPITSEGRTVGTFLIFVGIGLFSTLTAMIASWVLQERRAAPSSQ